jgi:hypothetical protein
MIVSVVHIRRKCLLLVAVLLSCGSAFAQQFAVKSFRPLNNDISAYVNPVKDLNDEACALIKVVGDRDFVFSTPLGIVKRKNETGEIWIYVPHGTVFLTIKHPQWGVLRDYRFPSPLETRLTYELVIKQPSQSKYSPEEPLVDSPAYLDTALHGVRTPQLKKQRVHQPLNTLVLAEVGIHSGHPSVGMLFAVLRRHGVYLHVQSDMRAMPSTTGDCDKNGAVGSSSTPYYTDKTKEARIMALIGGIHRLTASWYIYEGAGYGKRVLAWQTSDGSYLRNKGYSYNGVAAEVGTAFSWRRVMLSAGLMTIKGKYWEPTVGIGYHF